MGFLSFIGKLFGSGRRWNGTPEQYLAMVQYMAHKNNAHYSAGELLQWGDVMQKVMKVDLRPYQDFRDLAINGTPDYSMVGQVEKGLAKVQHRRDLKKAIYGENADLGDDDVMKSDSEGAIFARKMAKDLAQHVRFSEEDQRKLDDC